MFEANEIDNKDRMKFQGIYTSLSALVSIVFPLIFGSIISINGFLKCLNIVIVIVIIRLILSFIFKDNCLPQNNKADVAGYLDEVKNNKVVKQVYKVNKFNGLTYSEGAFQSIITIYIITVFRDSLSLGIFTSIFCFINFLLGILIVKIIKNIYYTRIIKFSMILTIVSLCVMLYEPTIYTIVIFNLFQTISNTLRNLINGNIQYNMSNIEIIKDKYKVEYFLGIEFSLFLGRLISQFLFILMTFVNRGAIIFIFIIFLILLTTNSIKLQNYIVEVDKC